MGSKGREIVGLDVDELLVALRKAYSDEWLAYYQYWVGAKIAKGPMKEAVIAELELHATEELNHALMVTHRIIQLGGEPVSTCIIHGSAHRCWQKARPSAKPQARAPMRRPEQHAVSCRRKVPRDRHL